MTKLHTKIHGSNWQYSQQKKSKKNIISICCKGIKENIVLKLNIVEKAHLNRLCSTINKTKINFLELNISNDLWSLAYKRCLVYLIETLQSDSNESNLFLFNLAVCCYYAFQNKKQKKNIKNLCIGLAWVRRWVFIYFTFFYLAFPVSLFVMFYLFWNRLLQR